MGPAIAYDDVVAAAAAIEGQVVRTPTARSITLSEITGADVWVKFESLQFTASYKERGALNRLLTLTPAERARGVVAMSAGNHAQALAHHGRRLGVPVTIVMPRTTPQVKVARTAHLGARVVLWGDELHAAGERAHAIERDEGLVFVPPYDDPAIAAGAGTVALEFLADAPDLEVLVVPTGGGGLLAGMAVAAKAIRPGIHLVGAQTELYPTFVNLLHDEHRPVGGVTIAEGIAVPDPGRITAPIILAHVDDVVSVGEDSIEEAVNLFLEIEKVVAEGAGATGLAALLEHPDRFRGRRVGLVLTGANIDPRMLATAIMRGLVRTGRLSRLRIGISDVPGQLGSIASIVGALGANIVEVAHQRLFSDLSLRSALLELAIETRDRDHAREVADGIRGAGLPVELLD